METRYAVPDAGHPFDRPIVGEVKGGAFVTSQARLPLDTPRTAAEARKEGIRDLKREAVANPEAAKALTALLAEEAAVRAAEARQSDVETGRIKEEIARWRDRLHAHEREALAAEGEMIRIALEATNWRVQPAADLLVMPNATLVSMLKGRHKDLGALVNHKRAETGGVRRSASPSALAEPRVASVPAPPTEATGAAPFDEADLPMPCGSAAMSGP